MKKRLMTIRKFQQKQANFRWLIDDNVPQCDDDASISQIEQSQASSSKSQTMGIFVSKFLSPSSFVSYFPPKYELGVQQEVCHVNLHPFLRNTILPAKEQQIVFNQISQESEIDGDQLKKSSKISVKEHQSKNLSKSKIEEDMEYQQKLKNNQKLYKKVKIAKQTSKDEKGQKKTKKIPSKKNKIDKKSKKQLGKKKDSVSNKLFNGINEYFM